MSLRRMGSFHIGGYDCTWNHLTVTNIINRCSVLAFIVSKSKFAVASHVFSYLGGEPVVHYPCFTRCHPGTYPLHRSQPAQVPLLRPHKEFPDGLARSSMCFHLIAFWDSALSISCSLLPHWPTFRGQKFLSLDMETTSR